MYNIKYSSIQMMIYNTNVQYHTVEIYRVSLES